jgi:hypothetical protein
VPIRSLTPVEAARHKALLAEIGDVGLLMPTATGMKKSIIDATISIRALLKEKRLHDYSLQQQGEIRKVYLQTKLVSEDNIVSSRTSLYRPITKKGDPRIWFSGLPAFAGPDDILAVFADGNDLAVINLTQSDLPRILKRGVATEMGRLLTHLSSEVRAVSNELLDLMRKIAREPVPAVCKGDTAVGRTLETILGIKQNSSQAPDYKGIELKSSRRGGHNRSTLFAQVPDWKKSHLKSSAEILERFGYESSAGRKLYCTVSSRSYNPRGLRLSLDLESDLLSEISNKSDCLDVVNWGLDLLHERLLTKHRETFWISATSLQRAGAEFFQYEAVRHTANPSVAQFDELLGSGGITVDHLIKSVRSLGAQEKGPLFKIAKGRSDLLFPSPKIYNLIEAIS